MFLDVSLVLIINAELICYDFYIGANLHWVIFHICVAACFALKTVKYEWFNTCFIKALKLCSVQLTNGSFERHDLSFLKLWGESGWVLNQYRFSWCFSPLLWKDNDGGFYSFQGSKVQTRVGLLMLLCTWLSNCSIAVTHFLHNPANIPFVSLTRLPGGYLDYARLS